jgi:hypothetical protein
MNELPYASDLTAAQWALIEPLLPAAKPRGRGRKVDLRSITNVIFNVLKGRISKLRQFRYRENPFESVIDGCTTNPMEQTLTLEQRNICSFEQP